MENKIKISLSRKMIASEGYSWKEYSLKPEEYFDIEALEEEETLDIDSIPLYLEPIEYLYDLEEYPFEKKDILEIKVVFHCQCKTRIHSEKFWNDGKNCLIEHLHLYPDYYYHAIIVGTLIDGKYDEVINLQKTIGMDTFDMVGHSVRDAETEEEFYGYTNEKYKL